MTTTTDTAVSLDRIRAVYDEYPVGDSTVGMLTDPLNEHAWLYTTDPVPVEP
ncbi:MAG: hypothetical protein V5A45_04520 [Haloarculaceae archaeon]|uniref:hypothetical protein n=1 Tax=Salinibaculum salinum TaxID=3131996 RepID=UPI002FC3F48C